jgi:hypothetical protein
MAARTAQAKVGLPNFGWHRLRHTFATSYLRHGGDIVRLSIGPRPHADHDAAALPAFADRGPERQPPKDVAHASDISETRRDYQSAMSRAVVVVERMAVRDVECIQQTMAHEQIKHKRPIALLLGTRCAGHRGEGFFKSRF